MDEKNLELIFKNEQGRTVRITLPSPVEPVDSAAVDEVMDLILAENIFLSSGGDWVEKVGARVVSRTVEEIPINVE